jgi:hypothetical protein
MAQWARLSASRRSGETDLARAHEPSDLREAGPIEMRHGFGRHLDTARLDAAVAFFDSFCGPKIRRRTVVDPGRL